MLCVNAGIGQGGLFAETDLQRELKMVDLNVRGAIQLTKLVLKDMVARDRGRLLFTSSISATMPGSSVDPLTLCLVPARGRASPACTVGPASSGTKIAAKGSYDEAVVEPRKAQGRRRHVLSGARCVGRLHIWQDGRRRAGSQAFSFSSWAMSRSH